MTQQINRSDTPRSILAATKRVLVDEGFVGLSTRTIAAQAAVPLSQILHHLGSKQKVVLPVMEEEKRILLERQERMFDSDLGDPGPGGGDRG